MVRSTVTARALSTNFRAQAWNTPVTGKSFIAPGVQAEPHADAGPVRVLLGGGHAPAAFL
jgi:hypothetical protein